MKGPPRDWPNMTIASKANREANEAGKIVYCVQKTVLAIHPLTMAAALSLDCVQSTSGSTWRQ